MHSTVSELALKPVGEDQIKRAREIASNSFLLQKRLDEFLATNPTRGEMIDFMEALKNPIAPESIASIIDEICKVAGIENPTGADRLLALQIGLLQEQNALLRKGLTQTSNKTSGKVEQNGGDGLSCLLGGILVGVALGS